jgi:hypothetical protein
MYERLNVTNVPSVLNPGVTYQNTTKFTAMYKRINVTNVPSVLNLNLVYQDTAKFTAMLEDLNVKNVEILTNMHIIYQFTIVNITLMYEHSSARNVTKLLSLLVF